MMRVLDQRRVHAQFRPCVGWPRDGELLDPIAELFGVRDVGARILVMPSGYRQLELQAECPKAIAAKW